MYREKNQPRIYEFAQLPHQNSPTFHAHEVLFRMNQKVADRIKELRLKINLSQEGLSHLANLDRKYIGIIEKGNNNVSIQVLYQICEALDISVSDFFKEF